ncbi:hypothetical protein ACWDA3_59295 [Nonomuraea rubra]
MIAFASVLFAGVLLICVGHVAPTDLAIIAAGLGGLYAVWRGRADRDEDDRRK